VTRGPDGTDARLRLRRWLVTAAAIALLAAVAWTVPAAGQGSGAGGEDHSLSVGAAVVLGLVEGLTEYLPVSSTGHLLVANEALGLGGTPAADQARDAYAICIQAGAILAVLVLYHRRIRQMIEGVLGRSDDGRAVAIAVAAAFAPTAALGFALRDVVRDNLFSAGPVAAAWLVGGLVILALERRGFLQRGGTELHQITLRQAALIGLAQSVALWPGTSRSLVTIIAAVLVGLSLAAAVEFSFLLGLVTLTSATLLTAVTDGQLLVDTFGYLTPMVGLVVAFGAAVASVRWMVAWLQQRGLDVFGYYRTALGVAAFAAIGLGGL
jgi:undecaprenyl-diphosphatase